MLFLLLLFSDDDAGDDFNDEDTVAADDDSCADIRVTKLYVMIIFAGIDKGLNTFRTHEDSKYADPTLPIIIIIIIIIMMM